MPTKIAVSGTLYSSLSLFISKYGGSEVVRLRDLGTISKTRSGLVIPPCQGFSIGGYAIQCYFMCASE